MPLQLGCYSHVDQTVEHAVKSMEGANFGIMTPEVGASIERALEQLPLRHRRAMSSNELSNSFHYDIGGEGEDC